MEKSKRPLVIAGGGTGGHIYPGIAIAKAFQQLESATPVIFVGSPDGLEAKIVPREGYPLFLIKVGKLNQKGLLGKLKTLLRIPMAMIRSFLFLLEQKPAVVLGVGGFASGPMVLMAAILGFPTVIWEPNAHPGLTNRWLSRFVNQCLVVFDSAAVWFKNRNCKTIGMPIRESIDRLGQDQDSQQLQSKTEFHILVFGGSQGARTLNKVVRELFANPPAWMEEVKLIHQVGSQDYPEMKDAYASPNFEVHEFLHDMEKRYQWADLVICRAGASTVAEIAAARKPAIFVPLPWAADDHQRKNAEVLVDKGAAKMLLQKDLSAQSLEKLILDLRADESRRRSIQASLKQFHYPGASGEIAKTLQKLLRD